MQIPCFHLIRVINCILIDHLIKSKSEQKMDASVIHKKRCLLALLGVELLDEKNSGKTRKWIKRRKRKGYYKNIVRELSMEDLNGYTGCEWIKLLFVPL